MSPEQVIEILHTREKIAKSNGNTTELSFIYEMLKISEEYKLLKEKEKK